MPAPKFLRTLRAALVAVALLASTATVVRAQNTLTETDKERILKRLDEIRGISREARFGRYTAALNAYTAAAETPAKSYAFYLDCVKLVSFDQHGKSFSEYREWKEKNIKWIRATEHSTMLQLQLQYLVMTIRALHMDDRSKIIPQLQTYIETTLAKQKSMGEHIEGLQESITNTVFAQAYDLNQTLQTDKEWEFVPFNIMGHFQQLILPLLREEGNSKGLERAWDRLISMETEALKPVEDVKRKDDFVKKRLPSLHWAKWTDVAENGERARAAMKMLDILENNKAHESAENWIQDLVNLVNAGSITDADFETD